ncbi:hypothetical protein [Lentilactobacillus diolivorans]|uniref:Uncharacterized protein n=2 Tax=Lentilactobacillus diolivorans TaxID=179838 RepID=A0A0R1SRX3_9LACO|nr:hypothetical protein [Lentilactobacillus diolivorans]KRL69234.1 hypothetical protein FC85_GL001594 [Lentilactobacillus diolivorans DSM 14421]GEP23916.1 hypothetical protein LDI01_15090 [Lentilactobacillus diolivorans]
MEFQVYVNDISNSGFTTSSSSVDSSTTNLAQTVQSTSPSTAGFSSSLTETGLSGASDALEPSTTLDRGAVRIGTYIYADKSVNIQNVTGCQIQCWEIKV